MRALVWCVLLAAVSIAEADDVALDAIASSETAGEVNRNAEAPGAQAAAGNDSTATDTARASLRSGASEKTLVQLADDTSETVDLSRPFASQSAGEVAAMAMLGVLGLFVTPMLACYRFSAQFRTAIAEISAKRRKSDIGLPLTKLESMVAETPLSTTSSSSSLSRFQPRLLALPNNAAFRSVFSPTDVALLVKHLPYHLSAKDWRLLFSTEADGFSLHALYRRTSGQGPCVLGVMDTNRNVLAAFCSESIKLSGRTHFGNGECFVAAVHPVTAVHHWSGGSNVSFVCANDAFLSFGSNGFALCVDAALERGTSEKCETFGNPGSLLLAQQESFSFKIVTLEVWGFSSPSVAKLGTTALFNTVHGVVAKMSKEFSKV